MSEFLRGTEAIKKTRQAHRRLSFSGSASSGIVGAFLWAVFSAQGVFSQPPSPRLSLRGVEGLPHTSPLCMLVPLDCLFILSPPNKSFRIPVTHVSFVTPLRSAFRHLSQPCTYVIHSSLLFISSFLSNLSLTASSSPATPHAKDLVTLHRFACSVNLSSLVLLGNFSFHCKSFSQCRFACQCDTPRIKSHFTALLVRDSLLYFAVAFLLPSSVNLLVFPSLPFDWFYWIRFHSLFTALHVCVSAFLFCNAFRFYSHYIFPCFRPSRSLVTAALR